MLFKRGTKAEGSEPDIKFWLGIFVEVIGFTFVAGGLFVHFQDDHKALPGIVTDVTTHTTRIAVIETRMDFVEKGVDYIMDRLDGVRSKRPRRG